MPQTPFVLPFVSPAVPQTPLVSPCMLPSRPSPQPGTPRRLRPHRHAPPTSRCRARRGGGPLDPQPGLAPGRPPRERPRAPD
eukprot:scaffold126787_cov69-Phaeocystis_antarctica.AAC.2